MKNTYHFADSDSAAHYQHALKWAAGIRTGVQVVIIIGPSGSGKTTMGRELIAAAGGDEEAVKMVTPLPEDRAGFTAQAVQFLKAGVVHFDNVYRIRKGVRNGLLELARGGAFTWTPTGEKVPLAILTPRCFVVINGHDGPLLTPELARVALVIRLAAAPEHARHGRIFYVPSSGSDEHVRKMIQEFSCLCEALKLPYAGPLKPPATETEAPTRGEIIKEARILSKLCISDDNKVVSIGKLTFASAKALEVWVKDQVKELRPPPSIHASVDIETWGTASGSAVSVIGAVKFNAKGLVGIPFYIRIDLQSCIDAGLSIDPDTVKWWMSQSDDARKEMRAAGVSLRSALEAFGWWLCDGNGKDIGVWGNGWDFDGGRLGDAYAAARLRLPWDYWQGRDLRTLEAEHPEVKDEPEGVAHNALDDARVQARKVIRLWEAKANLLIKAA
jgi:hypothetical protein